MSNDAMGGGIKGSAAAWQQFRKDWKAAHPDEKATVSKVAADYRTQGKFVVGPRYKGELLPNYTMAAAKPRKPRAKKPKKPKVQTVQLAPLLTGLKVVGQGLPSGGAYLRRYR
jgi:hypothetical protein